MKKKPFFFLFILCFFFIIIIILDREKEMKREHDANDASCDNKKQRMEPVGVDAIPPEIFVLILFFCKQYAFVVKFVCRQWRLIYNAYSEVLYPQDYDRSRVGTFPPSFFNWLWEMACSKTPFQGSADVIFRRLTRTTHHAATWGNIALAKHILPPKGNPMYMCQSCLDEHYAAAGNSGQLEFIKWLKARQGNASQAILPAARNGHVEVLEWILKEVEDSWDRQIAIQAAIHGQLEVCQWVYKRDKFIFCNHELEHAAKGGHLAVVRWIYYHGIIILTETAFANAANSGNLKLLQWLKEVGCPWNKYAFHKALRNGNLENLEWLWKHKCPRGNWNFGCAGKGGHLEVCKWLYAKGLRPSVEEVEWAGMTRRSEIFEWMKKVLKE